MAKYPLKKSLGSNTLSRSPQSCPIEGDTIHCHETQHINLKKGQRHRESPCQKGQHLEQKSAQRAQSIHWTEKKPTSLCNKEEIWNIFNFLIKYKQVNE
jgi:hypothetical protein